MKRQSQKPRHNWEKTVENLGLSFHTIDNEVYWDESAAYEFTLSQIEEIETATQELEEMCLHAVDHVVKNSLYDQLKIAPQAHGLIEASWTNGHKNLYGRFDFSYNGKSPPKLLEYNADTPTSLLEASVIQWQWLEETHPQADQFNSIHEKLMDAWGNFDLPSHHIHFSCLTDNQEDNGLINYLQDTALQSSLTPHILDIRDIGWNGLDFVDTNNDPIITLFKLYPWEWMMGEGFADNIIKSNTVFIEPAWKMILSNKGVLPLLWSLYPNHPYLLPSYTTPSALGGDMVKKPFYSREGANIEICKGSDKLSTSGPYTDQGYIYQAYSPLPVFDGNYPVIGSWVIASEPAGVGIREDKSPITTNGSRFIPHYFV